MPIDATVLRTTRECESEAVDFVVATICLASHTLPLKRDRECGTRFKIGLPFTFVLRTKTNQLTALIQKWKSSYIALYIRVCMSICV